MNITPEMMVEDEQRWHARDVITELGYCGNYMRDRKNMTNLDIRFYAYIMRKAHDMLKAQEPRVMTLEEIRERAESIDPDPIFVEWGNDTGATAWIAQAIPEIYSTIKAGYVRLRVWTGRPTEVQRENTPWEEGSDAE